MKTIPNYVNKGELIKADWNNRVVDALKYNMETDAGESIISRGKKRLLPFDVTDIKPSGSNWIIKIKKGFYYEYGSNDKVSIKYGTTNLEDYPEITTVDGKSLYFNYNTKELVWQDEDQDGNVKILDIEYTGGGAVRIENVHPFDIDVRQLPPFFPIVANNNGSYSVAVIPGYVNERVTNPTGGALAKHTPTNMLDAGKLKFNAIGSDQQVSIKVSVNEGGQIQGVDGGDAVSLVIEAKDTDSTHFYPPCGDDQTGQKGTYHYCLGYLTGDTFKNVLGGSHLDHWQDIPTIDNTTTEATDGLGRVVKEYKNTEDKFLVRTIKQRDSSPQVKIKELDESIEVTGNSLSGKLFLVQGETYEGGEPEQLMTWEDGLVTSGDNTITIPLYEAGKNIEITGPVNNVYTINCTLSSTSLSSNTLSGKTGTIRAYYGNDLDVVHGEFENGLYVDPGGDSIIEIPYYNAGQGISITPDGANEFTISSTLTGRNMNLEVNNVHYDNDGHVYYDAYATTMYFRNGLFVGVTDPGDTPDNLITEHVSYVFNQA